MPVRLAGVICGFLFWGPAMSAVSQLGDGGPSIGAGGISLPKTAGGCLLHRLSHRPPLGQSHQEPLHKGSPIIHSANMNAYVNVSSWHLAPRIRRGKKWTRSIRAKYGDIQVTKCLNRPPAEGDCHRNRPQP